jgi:hypothetical protein
LQNLESLLLEEGILTGTIPSQLGEVGTLEYVVVVVVFVVESDEYDLTFIFSSVACDCRRRQIDLNFNLLQGPIPEELYTLTNLRTMDLNDNELTGTISTRISRLVRLSFFQIENNDFTGTIPSQLGALNFLEGE